MWHNVKNAFLSIWSNKVRSILTVLGVVIGVTSVTTLVSLGQGLKNDVSNLIRGFGTDVLILTSGKIDTSAGSQNSNPANFISGDILTLNDIETIQEDSRVTAVAPISLVPGSIKYNDKTAVPTIFGTYPNFLDIFTIVPLQEGQMFTSNSEGNVLLLGKNPTQALFGGEKAVGKKVTIGQEEYQVIGTLGETKTAGVVSSEYDNVVLIPFDTATKLNKNRVQISRIIVKAKGEETVGVLKDDLKAKILSNHNGEEDFSILTPEDLLDLFNTFLNLATTMVSAIAAISLIVGGIGIMNIMLVTVTERTREIGLRKAVGATKTAILVQFLTEAIMVTLVGSVIGLGISFLAGVIIRSQTELKPVITPTIILIAVGISVVVGIIFGLWPALRAANKDPIEALRYE